jgi:hypothetical protein
MKLVDQVLDIWRGMTPARWLQLATLALAVIGYLQWLGDKKWEDEKRAYGNRQFLRLVRTLWGLVLLALGILVVANFAHKERAPAFEFYVDNFPTRDHSHIPVPVINNSHTFTFQVLNSGSLAAQGLTLVVRFPAPLVCTATGQVWSKIEGLTTNYGPSADSAFMAEVKQLLTAGDRASFPGLTVQASNLTSFVSQLLLSADANNAPNKKAIVWVDFKNAVDR